jgi:hypothetical protein
MVVASIMPLNLAGPNLPDTVMQDILLPYLSTESTANEKFKENIASGNKKRVMSTLGEIGRGNGE